MQPPPYPPSPYPPPVPPGRRGSGPLILGLAGGAVLLVLLAVAGAVVVRSNGSSHHTVRGTLQLRKVLAVTPSACPAGDAGRVTSVKADACYQLGDGMTVTKVKDARLVPPDASRGQTGYSVEIAFQPQDAARFGTLSGEVAREQPPRNQLAIVVDGKVSSAPTVAEAITGGKISIAGAFTRKDAQHYVDLFRN